MIGNRSCKLQEIYKVAEPRLGPMLTLKFDLQLQLSFKLAYEKTNKQTNKQTNSKLDVDKLYKKMGFPGGTNGKEPACRRHKRHGLGRSPGGGHGNPLQDSYLENPMDREAWWATVHKVPKS